MQPKILLKMSSTPQHNNKPKYDYVTAIKKQGFAEAWKMLNGGVEPPNDADMEKVILGAVISQSDAMLQISHIFKSDLFYNQNHQKIATCCIELYDQHKPIDLITLTEQLKKLNWLDQIGGAHYLVDLSNRVASAANIFYHTLALVELFQKRQIIYSTLDAIKNIREGEDVFTIQDKLLEGVRFISPVDYFRVRSMNDALRDAEKEPDMLQLAGPLCHNNELVFVFAPPGVGKSIFAVQMGDAVSRGDSMLSCLVNEAWQEGAKKVLFFDFELKDKELEKRYSNEYDAKDKYQFADTFLRIDMNPEFDDFPDGVDVSKFIIRKIEDIIKVEKPHFVIIDNITRLAGENISDPAVAGKIMNRLLKIQLKYACAIVVVAHTTKQYQKVQPLLMGNMGGAAAFANFAQGIIAIGRSASNEDEFYIKQLKGRNGCYYDEHKVIVMERHRKHDKMLAYQFLRFDKELNLLMTFDNPEDNIEDELLNNALKLKCTTQKSWAKIKEEIGWLKTEESLRKKAEAYAKDSGKYKIEKGGRIIAIATVGDSDNAAPSDSTVPF